MRKTKIAVSIAMVGGGLVGSIAASGYVPATVPANFFAAAASAEPAPSALTAAADGVEGARQASAMDCANLTGRHFGSGTVETARHYAAGSTVADGETGGATVARDVCLVRVTIRETPGSIVRAEVWLPDSWNRKLMGFGGGGVDGSLSKDSSAMLNPAIEQGYAAVVGDLGHALGSNPADWAVNQPERMKDFGYRGGHLAATVAKQIVTALYGAPATRAYFQGCSGGGREALSLVSRYPEDYDAVIAGAPAARYTEIVTQVASFPGTLRSAPRLQEKLGLVASAVLKQCDALDGVPDGIIADPRRCGFDPSVLKCTGGDSATCLTPPELTALRSIYAGPHLRDGTLVMQPPMVGSEGVPGGWSNTVTNPFITAIIGQAIYGPMVFNDPKWTLANFDLDRDYPIARRTVAPIINSDDPDLRAFVRRGGKLIIYQGWSDPLVTPGGTLSYYANVRRRLGSSTADRHVRLFMVPGMGHCAGGPGATKFDMQKELENWDRTGVAPTRIVATKPDVPSGDPPLSRPLCAFPMTARYLGAGSTRDAANFACRKAL